MAKDSMRQHCFVYITILSLLETVAVITQAYYMGEIVDYADGEFHHVLTMVLIIAATMIVEIVTKMMSNYGLGKYSNRKRCELREKLVGKLLKAQYRELDGWESGKVLNVYDGDIEQLLEYDRTMFRAASVVLKVVLPLYFLFTMNPLVTGCILLASIVSLVPGMLIGNLHYEKRMQLNQKGDELNEGFLRSLSFVKIIKAYNAENFYAQKTEENMAQYRKSRNSLEGVLVVYTMLNRISGILPFLSLYLVGAIFVLRGSFTLGGIVASSFFLGILSDGIGGVQSIISTKQAYRTAKERFLELMELKEGSLRREINPAKETGLALCNVSFGYVPEKDVLKNLTISIKEKSKWLIRGESGCGKTTLLRILEGLYEPTGGTLQWNSSKEECREVRLSVAEQETFLFPKTVRENICMVNENLSEAKFVEICRVAGVDESLLLENGEERVVTELGKNLSKGQLQRINIARALAKEADVYLFDEPTAGLNAELEEQVLCGIMEYLREKTVIMILHNSKYQHLFTEVLNMNEPGGNNA